MIIISSPYSELTHELAFPFFCHTKITEAAGAGGPSAIIPLTSPIRATLVIFSRTSTNSPFEIPRFSPKTSTSTRTPMLSPF